MKTLSFDGEIKKYENPMHIVSAKIAELGITFGQKTVDGKSNEIAVVQESIETLDICGCVIVADALNCPKETAKKIIENGGAYILSVKNNQPSLRSEIEEYIQDDYIKKLWIK